MNINRIWTTVPAAAAVSLLGVGVTASAASAAPAAADVPIEHEAVDPATIPHLGMTVRPSREGVKVLRVQEDGPADAAGIVTGDVLVSIDGVELDHPGALREAHEGLEPGETVSVVLERDGEEITVRLTVGSKADMPGPEECVWFGARPERPGHDELPPRGGSGERPQLPLVIGEVVAGSPADDAGVQVGDEILSANGVELAGLRDALELLHDLDPGDTVTLTVDRDGTEVTLVVVLASQADNPNFEEERAERQERRQERRAEMRERIQEFIQEHRGA